MYQSQAGDEFPNILNYELTFKVTGLSFLFCDLLADGFSYLEPLFICDQKEFRQYFPNDKMRWAENEGNRWLGEENGFDKYKEEFKQFHNRARSEFAEILKVEKLTRDLVKSFFEMFEKYLNYYSRMDYQFTNKVFGLTDGNLIIKENLAKLAAFKDVARVWVNQAVIDEDSFYAKTVEKIAKQFKMSRETVENCKANEILQLFEGLEVNSEENKARSDTYSIYHLKNERYYLAGKDACDFIKKVAEEEKTDTVRGEIIQGMVANKVMNEIQGEVRVINVDYDNMSAMNRKIAEMKEGEILVSEFTAPELILACKKAKAIVTDLGGALSHAAIVSRELGIPCVVGTKNATKILKDGEKISIDLTTGRIKCM